MGRTTIARLFDGSKGCARGCPEGNSLAKSPRGRRERLFDLVGEVGCGLDGAFGKGFSREVAKAARKPRRGSG